MNTYSLLKKLIESGKTDGLIEKIDVFFACGRITESEYTELIELINPIKEEPAEETAVE